MGLQTVERKNYAYILADGKIRVPAEEGAVGAVKREYETSDGKSGVKWEMVYDKIDGLITGISFFEGDFGKQLQIEIDGITLSMNVASNFAEDLMKKLPNVDLSKPVELSPYNFTNDKGKSNKGISVIQDGEKIFNYFWDVNEQKLSNGYPELPEGYQKFDSDDWKAYFIGARKFLIKYVEENIMPSLAIASLPDMGDDIKAEDIPM